MSGAVSAPPTSRAAAGDPTHYRRQSKIDQWICWWSIPIFFNLFGLIFVPLTRVMPPPRPDNSTDQIVAFFHDHALTIQIGFGLLLVVIGWASWSNGLVALQIKRMSVGSGWAYAYIASLAVGALPGCLLAAFAFLTATLRPDRDPQLLVLLYDMGLLMFVGSLGCFSTQYLILALAILFDKNKIFPKWMAYISIWQIVTELLAIPVFIFRTGAFAWNGAISFWQGTAIFVVYQVCIIVLLFQAIKRQPLGESIQDF
jgi:hypothetical protein